MIASPEPITLLAWTALLPLLLQGAKLFMSGAAALRRQDLESKQAETARIEQYLSHVEKDNEILRDRCSRLEDYVLLLRRIISNSGVTPPPFPEGL